jgi:hypothetical protein
MTIAVWMHIADDISATDSTALQQALTANGLQLLPWPQHAQAQPTTSG